MSEHNEKFKLKSEAFKRAYDLLPEVTHIYKGHRHWVLQRPNYVEKPKEFEQSYNDELNADGKIRMSKKELDKKILEGKDHPLKIPTIKLVRVELCCGLKEALDYCNNIWNR
jgi:hypothetical protein